ncbi:MAG: hypothetical protein K8R54_13140 [Bacteroidales bacterium]|nr:hypothetical protein [Bacteroidales bacterium]
MENNKNEIDLIELLIKIYLYLKKYYWVFLIAIVAGFVFAFIKNKYFSKEFESSMIISVKSDNDYINYNLSEKPKTYKNQREIIEKLINSINSQIISENFTDLSKKLLIPENQLTDIKSIKSDNNEEDKSELSNIYKIDVVIKDTEILNYFGEGIKYYINNNSFIKKQIKSDSLFLTSVISKIELKIIELDNLQKQILEENFRQSNLAIIGNRSYITESIRLVSLREKLQSELFNLEKVNIIEEFYIPTKQTGSLIKDLFLSVAIMLFIGFIIISLIILNNKAKQYKSNKPG